MNLAKTLITSTIIDYSVSQFENSSIAGLCAIEWSSSAFENQLISSFNYHFNNSSEDVKEYLYKNISVSKYVDDFVVELSKEGFMWTGELKLINLEEDSKKLLIIYRPILPNTSSITQLDIGICQYDSKDIYKSLIRDLFKRNKDVKNAVIIDEQII